VGLEGEEEEEEGRVDWDGVFEILMAVGFEKQVIGTEESLICPTDTPLNIAQMAQQKLLEIQKSRGIA